MSPPKLLAVKFPAKLLALTSPPKLLAVKFPAKLLAVRSPPTSLVVKFPAKLLAVQSPPKLLTINVPPKVHCALCVALALLMSQRRGGSRHSMRSQSASETARFGSDTPLHWRDFLVKAPQFKNSGA